MSDKDDLSARGIPFFSLVDEFGVSTDGTSASMNTIRSRGMPPICEVNSSGVATSGSTLEELRRRGIRFYCAVTENAVTSDAVTLAILRSRGIPFLCPVDVNGIAVGGTATITQLAAKGMPYVCLLDSLGSPGGGAPSISAPVLAMDPAWVTTDNEPDFTIDVDDTVTAGDTVRLQVQAAGGDWSSLVSNTTHIITAPEDVANEIDLELAALPNANYEARANVTDGVSTSGWSNTVSFTIAAVTANQRISSTGNNRISSAGNNRIFA
jgi:hypothetical protein